MNSVRDTEVRSPNLIYVNRRGSKVRTYAPERHESIRETTSLQRVREEKENDRMKKDDEEER